MFTDDIDPALQTQMQQQQEYTSEAASDYQDYLDDQNKISSDQDKIDSDQQALNEATASDQEALDSANAVVSEDEENGSPSWKTAEDQGTATQLQQQLNNDQSNSAIGQQVATDKQQLATDTQAASSDIAAANSEWNNESQFDNNVKESDEGNQFANDSYQRFMQPDLNESQAQAVVDAEAVYKATAAATNNYVTPTDPIPENLRSN